MGNAAVSTGTVCAFPFVLDNVSDPLTSTCSRTYGEALDPGLLIVQIGLEVYYGLIILPIILFRLKGLFELKKAQPRLNVRKTVQFKIFVVGLTFTVVAMIAWVDPKGWRNIYPVALYHVLDEINASCLFIMGFLFIEFCTETAHKSKAMTKKDHLPTYLLVTTSILVVFNFVGLEVIAMLVPEQYGLLNSIKLLGASLLLMVYCVISWRARSSILGVLDRSGTDVSLRSSICCGRSAANVNSAEKAIMTVKRKFFEWYIVAILGSMACLVFGLLDLSEYLEIVPGENTWVAKFEDQPQVTFIGFQTLYLLAIALVIRLFIVPKVTDSRLESHGSKTDLRQGSKSELRQHGSSHSKEFNTSVPQL